MFNRSDLRLPMLHLPLRLAYYLFSLYYASQFSKVGIKFSRYPRVCFSIHCRHNHMVHTSLWQPPLHRRSTCQSSQRRRSSSSCLPLVSQRHSRHIRSRQVWSTSSVCIPVKFEFLQHSERVPSLPWGLRGVSFSWPHCLAQSCWSIAYCRWGTDYGRGGRIYRRS